MKDSAARHQTDQSTANTALFDLKIDFVSVSIVAFALTSKTSCLNLKKKKIFAHPCPVEIPQVYFLWLIAC